MKDIRKKYVVQSGPQMFSMFDRTCKLAGTTALTEPVSIQSWDGKDELFVRGQGGMDWKQDGCVQVNVCRVKDAPVGKHLEIWMPRGVKTSSISWSGDEMWTWKHVTHFLS